MTTVPTETINAALDDMEEPMNRLDEARALLLALSACEVTIEPPALSPVHDLIAQAASDLQAARAKMRPAENSAPAAAT